MLCNELLFQLVPVFLHVVCNVLEQLYIMKRPQPHPHHPGLSILQLAIAQIIWFTFGSILCSFRCCTVCFVSKGFLWADVVMFHHNLESWGRLRRAQTNHFEEEPGIEWIVPQMVQPCQEQSGLCIESQFIIRARIGAPPSHLQFACSYTIPISTERASLGLIWCVPFVVQFLLIMNFDILSFGVNLSAIKICWCKNLATQNSV